MGVVWVWVQIRRKCWALVLKQASIIGSLILTVDLCLSGVWVSVDLKTNAKDMHVQR